jgi:hypothetical protein
MLCDRYQGGTVAAATPQRVGEMRLCRQLLAASAKPSPIGPSRTGIFGEADPPTPLKNEIKYQSHEK